MRVPILKRLVWMLNLLLASVVIGYGYWVFAVDSANARNGVFEVAEPKVGPSIRMARTQKQLSVAELESVFSRKYVEVNAAPPEFPETLTVPIAPSVPPEKIVKKIKIPRPSLPALGLLIEVIAVFHSKDRYLSGAVIANKKQSGQQKLYLFGEWLEGVQAKITGIDENTVKFLYGDRSVMLRIVPQKSRKGSSAPAASPPNPEPEKDFGPIDPRYHHEIPRSEVLEVVSKPLQYLRGMKYTLISDKGKVLGFKLRGIARDSVVGRYGIRNNDIVVAVNGNKIDSNFNLFGMLPQVLSSTKVRLTVRRNKEDLDFTYEIK